MCYLKCSEILDLRTWNLCWCKTKLCVTIPVSAPASQTSWRAAGWNWTEPWNDFFSQHQEQHGAGGASFVLVQKEQTLTKAVYSLPALFYFFCTLQPCWTQTGRCRRSIPVSLAPSPPLCPCAEPAGWQQLHSHSSCLSSHSEFILPDFHGIFSLLHLLFVSVYPGEAQLGF